MNINNGDAMQFNTYLKTCRERNTLTQEQLVQELYNLSENFSGLDASGLSRWERGVSLPSLSKQVQIVKHFQSYSDKIFPCLEDQNTQEIENGICTVGIKNLIGNSKLHVLNYPCISFEADDITINHLRSAEDIDRTLQMPHAVMQGFTDNNPGMSTKLLKAWGLHPSNLFLLAETHGQFFGLFFNLRLKPEVFDEVMNFEKQVFDLTDDDFADFDEMGSNYPLLFFANNEKVASLLFIRYYAHLIANQDNIEEVGTTPVRDGGKKIAAKMHLSLHKEKKAGTLTRSAYRAPLADVLINEVVMKMIFQKQDVPEE